MATIIKFVVIAMICIVALCLWNQIMFGSPACDPVTIIMSLVGQLLCLLVKIIVYVIQAVIGVVAGLIGYTGTLPSPSIPCP